ncbi:uncharacterized protein YoxC [Jeotgalibacillus terrae]|uniref:hypothetical protein n=1 Tax=Jeotgalibacillus terrae TaxID=587735 RepID=UPI00195AE9C8|nr:hypothetical protein [Jeotgalibacillus terrae]MBM7579593.1 uncharacterized protein YoxC [Jeotgalibacillus terrae]
MKTDWLHVSFSTSFIFVFKNRISSTFSRVTLSLFVIIILWQTVIFCQEVLRKWGELVEVQDITGWVHEMSLVVQKINASVQEISTVVQEINRTFHEIMQFDLHNSHHISHKKSPASPEKYIPGFTRQFTLEYPARF